MHHTNTAATAAKADKLHDDYFHRPDWANVMRAAGADRPHGWLLSKDSSGTILRNWDEGIDEARRRFETTPDPVTETLTVEVGDTIQKTLGSVPITASRFTITAIDRQYGLVEGHSDGEIDIDDLTTDEWATV